MNVKHLTPYSFLYALAFLTSCSQGQNQSAAEPRSSAVAAPAAPTTGSADFNKSYTGLIGGKYMISMNLNKTGATLSGSYFYHGKNASLSLSGSIQDDGTFELSEFTADGLMSGKFTGTIMGSEISGAWMRPDGTKSMTLSLSEQPQNQSSAASPGEPELEDWTGTYYDEYNVTLEVQGPDANGAVKFTLSYMSDKCAVQIEETAYLIRKDYAEYFSDGDDCYYGFLFDNGHGEITVRERDCQYGAGCGGLGGLFKKQ
jgi:hypothetical protein